MKNEEPYDVLIVGAGPAGSSAAKAAADMGATVLVLEKRKKIGEPVRCAEYVPRLLRHRVCIPREVIAQETGRMVTFMPDGEVIKRSAPGFVLDRGKFDRALALEASRTGAKILTEAEVFSFEEGRVRIRRPSGEREVRASVIIGADGPDSVVGSWIGSKNRQVTWAVQHTVLLKKPSHDTEIYMGEDYPGGYAWFFPKGNRANVGVGVRRELGGKTAQALEAFKERLKGRIGEVIHMAAGPIPVGGPLNAGNGTTPILLVGDAAGHTHPITGGGIPQAVIGGALAGRAAVLAARGDKGAIEGYFHKWTKAFGPMLDRATKRREQMEAQWNGPDRLGLLRRCWLTSREYYDDS